MYISQFVHAGGEEGLYAVGVNQPFTPIGKCVCKLRMDTFHEQDTNL